ncbi:hypothetical protein BKA93DRAFT_519209 [Sparassis latifolia]
MRATIGYQLHGSPRLCQGGNVRSCQCFRRTILPEVLYWPNYVAHLTDGSHSPRTSGVPPVAPHHPCVVDVVYNESTSNQVHGLPLHDCQSPPSCTETILLHQRHFAWTRRKRTERGTRHHETFKTGMSESFSWPNKPLRLLLSVAPFAGLGDLTVVGDAKGTIDGCLITLLGGPSE